MSLPAPGGLKLEANGQAQDSWRGDAGTQELALT